MYSLESAPWGDSNEYTQYQYTIFSIQEKKLTLSYPKSAAMEYGNAFEIAMVNEPSVLESLKAYCIFVFIFERDVKTARFTFWAQLFKPIAFWWTLPLLYSDESICHWRVSGLFCLIKNPVNKQCRLSSDAILEAGAFLGSIFFSFRVDPYLERSR